jgi:glutamate/aspartate transport system substrate-binding protein
MKKTNNKNYVSIAVLGLLGTGVNAQNLQQNNVQAPVQEVTSERNNQTSNQISAIAASPTLKKIRDSGVIKIGYRQIAPISYDVSGKAAGLAVEVCSEAIEEIKNFLDMRAIKVEHYQITSVQRIPFLQEGQIDLECGLTTNTAERRNVMAFSIPYFITGTKMLVQKANAAKFSSVNDLAGLPVATVKSTTAVKTIDTLNKQRLLNIKNIQYENYETAIESVIKGQTKAMILDEIILEDLKNKSSNPAALTTTGDFVSVEPLAVMMRKEKPLTDLVNKRLYDLMQSGKFEAMYQKWFKRPVAPEGINYNIDISPALREVIRFPNDIVGN